MSTEQSLAPSSPPDGPSPQEKRRRRLASYSVQNMVWSMLAVGVVVLAWWALTLNPDESQRRPPEVAQTASYVVEQAPWTVWVPQPGDEWVPTVVFYDPLEEVQTWHISYTSPQGEYVALHQAADVTDAWTAAVLGDAQPVGQAQLRGPGGTSTWQAWEGSPGSNAERGYLLDPEETGDATVVLHGTASEAEFQEFLDTVEARD